MILFDTYVKWDNYLHNVIDVMLLLIIILFELLLIEGLNSLEQEFLHYLMWSDNICTRNHGMFVLAKRNML